jgi:hypothetical protein
MGHPTPTHPQPFFLNSISPHHHLQRQPAPVDDSLRRSLNILISGISQIEIYVPQHLSLSPQMHFPPILYRDHLPFLPRTPISMQREGFVVEWVLPDPSQHDCMQSNMQLAILLILNPCPSNSHACYKEIRLRCWSVEGLRQSQIFTLARNTRFHSPLTLHTFQHLLGKLT